MGVFTIILWNPSCIKLPSWSKKSIWGSLWELTVEAHCVLTQNKCKTKTKTSKRRWNQPTKPANQRHWYVPLTLEGNIRGIMVRKWVLNWILKKENEVFKQLGPCDKSISYTYCPCATKQWFTQSVNHYATMPMAQCVFLPWKTSHELKNPSGTWLYSSLFAHFSLLSLPIVANALPMFFTMLYF